jgi:hypothetical protein
LIPEIKRIPIHVLQDYHIAARRTATCCVCPRGCPHRLQNFAPAGFAALHLALPQTRAAESPPPDINPPRFPTPPLSAPPARHANFKIEKITHPPNKTAVTPVIAINRKMVKKISAMII